MNAKLQILHLEDDAQDSVLIGQHLKDHGLDFELHRVSTKAEFEKALLRTKYDLILSDYKLPEFDGFKALEFARKIDSDIPFILVSGALGEEKAVESLKQGATDYLLKDRLVRLPLAINRGLIEAQKKKEESVAEERLKESEERFRLFMANSPAVAFIKDKDGKYLFVNAKAEEVLGKTSDCILGKTDFDLLPNNIAVDVRSRDQDILRSGKTVQAFETIPDQAGKPREWWIAKFPIFTEKSQLIGGIGSDLTEERRKEQQMQELLALLQLANDAIWVRKFDEGITYWNAGAEKLYGYSTAEMLGQKSSEALYPDGLADYEKANQTVLELGQWTGEVSQKTKDGKIITVHSSKTLFYDPSGKPSSILTINSDITEKKQLEAQILRNERLECIGVLASGIAHDLNNVLTPILIASELLQMDSASETSTELFQTIQRSAQHGADLIRQILAFGRGASGEPVELQLTHLLKDVLKLIRETFPRSIDIHFNLPADLWAIKAIPTQVHQVIMNLCVNARDAMPEGGKLEVRAENISIDENYTAARPEAKLGPYVVITVKDTGTGMDPEVLKHIYDPFFTTNDPGKGTGLGLANVKSILKNHEGFIHVYSELKKGTLFRLYFPAISTTNDLEVAAPQKTLPQGNGEQVLVVDDEADLCEVTCRILNAHGYAPLKANDGVEGLLNFIAHQDTIKVVLTDIMMPKMGGELLIRTLRRLHPNLKIIALSGMPEEINPDSISGARLLRKPFSAEELLTAVDQVLHP